MITGGAKMKQFMTAVIVLVLLAITSWVACATNDTQQGQETVTVHTGADQKQSDQEKANKEYKARAEAEKQKEVEKSESETHVYLPTGSTTSTSSSSFHAGSSTRTSSVAVVFAPGNDDVEPAVGVQWLNRDHWGIGGWISGNLSRDDDAIDASIPHNDYYTTSTHGKYSIQGLYCIGSGSTSLILGAGVTVDRTLYTDVSNVTGWEWNGGSDTSVEPAGQVGCRLRLVGGRLSLQFGYDTSQYGYFGLGMSF